MSSEKPQFTQIQTDTEPHEEQLWLDAYTGSEEALAAAFAGLEPANDSDDIRKFEKLPVDKMPAQDVAATATTPARTDYSPANPPHPPYTIEKNQIHLRDPGNKNSGSRWQTTGKIAGSIDCDIICDWQPDSIQPQDLNLEVQEFTYTNKDPDAKQSGLDISFISANQAVGKNTNRIGIYPTNDAGRMGYDCEIKSCPVKNADGTYSVSESRAFVNMNGALEKATVENIAGKDYQHMYSTQIHRFAGIDGDGNPAGLLSITFHADEDGGTTRPVKQINYTDDKGQPAADGKPTSTVIYDTTKGELIPLRTMTHKQFNGNTVINEMTEHDYPEPGCNKTWQFNESGQQWTNVTVNKVDGTPTSILERNLSDGTITLKLIDTVEFTENNAIPKLPGADEPAKGNAVLVFKQDSNKKYYIDHLEETDGKNNPLVTIKAPAGQWRLKYNGKHEVIGVEGAVFYKNGKPVDAGEVTRIFTEKAPASKQINQAWHDIINSQRK